MVIYALLIAGALAVFGGWSYWIADMSGDRREAQVRAEFAAAIERTNTDVGTFTELDEKLAALKAAERKKATEAALKVAGTKCVATEAQAQALNEIPQ